MKFTRYWLFLAALWALLIFVWMPRKAHALTDYEALHDAAHFGAGVAIGACVQTVNQLTGLTKAHPIVSDIMVLAVVAFAASVKEDSDSRWDWEQWGCTVAGGRLAMQITW